MGIIANTAKNIILAVGLLAGKPGLEGKTIQAGKEEKRYPTFEQGYRMRPPGAACDSTKYGGHPTQAPPDPKALYVALGMAAVAVLAYTLRKSHEQQIENSKPARSWDFFHTERPVVDYEIDREERES